MKIFREAFIEAYHEYRYGILSEESKWKYLDALMAYLFSLEENNQSDAPLLNWDDIPPGYITIKEFVEKYGFVGISTLNRKCHNPEWKMHTLKTGNGRTASNYIEEAWVLNKLWNDKRFKKRAEFMLSMKNII